jgi:alanine-synthesizing transaminase
LESEGGWTAVLRVPADRGDEERAIELMRKQRVVVHPGHFFDFPKDGFLVVSLITPVAEFAEGVTRILANLRSDGC